MHYLAVENQCRNATVGFRGPIAFEYPDYVRTPVLALIAVAAATSAAPAHAAGSCANADRSATAAPIVAMRAAVVCLIDRERTTHNLPPLRADSRLDRSAQGWSNAMVARHVFSHGANFAARISAAGLRWSTAGENIATGYRTPRQVVDAWMASKGHCENILDPNFRLVGTGVNRHGVAGFASGPATWTQDFALPAGQSPPSRNRAPAHRCPY